MLTVGSNLENKVKNDFQDLYSNTYINIHSRSAAGGADWRSG